MNPVHPSGPENPPLEAAAARLGPRSRSAAGLPGVLSALGFALEEMGVSRSVRTLGRINQTDGFDCQSCAWPNPTGARHAAEFCENGVKALADEATRRLIGADFFRRHSVADLAAESDHWLGQQGRLAEPLVLQPGATHYAPLSWEEALAIVAGELRSLGSPDAATFYTSGRTGNEAAFLYQLFVRAFGTNNLPDCSNLCHESSGSALGATLGLGKGCVTLDDFGRAELIFVIGQNPGTNHPRMLTALQTAKQGGARIIALNPLPEIGTERFANPQDLANPLKALGVLLGRGTALCDLWLPVRVNGDLAALQGILKALLDLEDQRPGTVLDRAFIERHTDGFDAMAAHLGALAWDDLVAESGLSREQMGGAAAMAAQSRATIACWAMGLTQGPRAVATIQEVVNLLLVGGHIGRPGAGPCPVRGHSNVQGDRTMGIFERPAAAFLDALAAEFAFEPPRRAGLDVVDSIRAMAAGRVGVFFALGGNFLSAAPDTAFTAAALRRCRLTAHVSTKLNRSHLVTGRTALILPCLGRSEIDRSGSAEQFVTTEDSMGVISPSRGVLDPPSPSLRSEVAIVAGLARATLGERLPLDWEALAADYDRIRDRIARVVPGFGDFNRRIRLGPFALPNAPRDRREFPTPSGRARFTATPLVRTRLEAGRLLMMTLRSHDQFNTTIYGLDDRYRGIFGGRRVVFMHPEDIRDRGLMQGQWVDLTGHFRGTTRTAPRFMVAPYPIPRGCAATYFPEANCLVPLDSVAPVSNTPTSKYVEITVAASAP